nr:l-type lectin-domain containing receptor kinase ix.1 [Quercus suber]
MQLWDKYSGNLTDFTTHFSFAIDSQNRSVYGDGLAFFLAPVSSKIPKTKGGSTIGLIRNDQALDSKDNLFVAVEFDIYSNAYLDPPGEHVGIDLNSLKSVANISWYNNIAIKEGKRNEAWISYNSSSHNFSVFFTGFRYNVPIRQFLSTNVDLFHFLPELVTFGFSASTGNSSSIHTIYSWDFSSSLEIDDNITITKDMVSSPNIPAPNQRKNNTLGLAVGLGSGGFVLVGGLALVLFALYKRSRRNKEDYVLDDCIDEEFERGRRPRNFSYNELVHATNDFDDKEKLGQGGFGAFNRGLLRDSNTFVAVKRVAKGSKHGLKEYVLELGLWTMSKGHKPRNQMSIVLEIVELEIACGRKAINPMAIEDQVVKVEWVWELYRKGQEQDIARERKEKLEALTWRLKGFNTDQHDVNCSVCVRHRY